MTRIAFTGPIVLKPLSMIVIIETLATLPKPSSDVQIITGGCVGLDEYVAEVLHTRGYHVHTVIPHDMSRIERDWLHHCSSHERTPEGHDRSHTYRLRNERMVALADRLIVFAYEIGRNGETMTYNIARKSNKPTQVVML